MPETIHVSVTEVTHFAPNIDEAMKKGATIKMEIAFIGVPLVYSLDLHELMIVLDEIKVLEQNKYEIVGHVQKLTSMKFTGMLSVNNSKISGKGKFTG